MKPSLVKVGIALLVLVAFFLLYAVDFHTFFQVLRGEAHIIIPLDDPQWSLVDPVIMVREGDPQTVLVTAGLPERLGPHAPVFVVHLLDSKFERFTVKEVQFRSAQILWPYPSQSIASEEEGSVLPGGFGNRRASLSFSGLHLKLPVYRPFSFPDPKMKGWGLVDSYSGTLRLEISGPNRNEIDLVLQQRLLNQRVLPRLSDLGFWLPNGKFFVFNALRAGDRRLFFFTATNGECPEPKGSSS